MPNACKATDLAEFQCLLIGTWSNDGVPCGTNGKPLSYNVMPLPQKDEPQRRGLDPDTNKYGGFLLKNFPFTEEVRFNGADPSVDPKHKDAGALAVAGDAPNRGGTYTQLPHALFYEQQVRFADGPQSGSVVHLENGAWLHLGSHHQAIGPYDNRDTPPQVEGQVLPQPPTITVAKQISIPHGNSILALGKVDLYDQDGFSHNLGGTGVNTKIPGKPNIPDAPVPYPIPVSSDKPRREFGISTSPYDNPFARSLNTNNEFEFENPDEKLALNPNYALQKAIELIDEEAKANKKEQGEECPEGITHHIHISVTTNPLFGGDGVVSNIPFEDRKSKVTEYSAEYWLLSTDGGYTFDYFAYSQTILMEMDIFISELGEYRRYVFPHLTSNTVKKLSGTPDDARAKTATSRGQKCEASSASEKPAAKKGHKEAATKN